MAEGCGLCRRRRRCFDPFFSSLWPRLCIDCCFWFFLSSLPVSAVALAASVSLEALDLFSLTEASLSCRKRQLFSETRVNQTEYKWQIRLFTYNCSHFLQKKNKKTHVTSDLRFILLNNFLKIAEPRQFLKIVCSRWKSHPLVFD